MFDKQSNVNAHTAPAADRKLAADRHNYAKKSTIVATKLTVRYTHIIKNKQQRVSTKPDTRRWSSSKHPHHRNATPTHINPSQYDARTGYVPLVFQ
jgi:hypothetical protein